jgi:hypothetical protein
MAGTAAAKINVVVEAQGTFSIKGALRQELRDFGSYDLKPTRVSQLLGHPLARGYREFVAVNFGKFDPSNEALKTLESVAQGIADTHKMPTIFRMGSFSAATFPSRTTEL